MRPESPRFASRALRGSLQVLDAWLAAPDGHRALALVGPPGIGATTLLAAFRSRLASCDRTIVVAATAGELCAARGLAGRMRRARQRAGRTARIVLLLDDTARSGARERDALAALRRADRGVRVVLTAAHAGQFPDVIPYAVPPLAGPEDAASGPDRLTGSEVARFLRHRSGVRRPAAGPQPAAPGALGRLCAASFGIPADADALAGLVAAHGPAAVDAALSEAGPRHRLADLLTDMLCDPPAVPTPGVAPGLRGDGNGDRPDGSVPSPRPPLTEPESAALAVLFAAPGGASVRMLRAALAACLPASLTPGDIAQVTASLVARGLVWSGGRPVAGGADGDGMRFHLRVTGLPLARWCAQRPGFPLAAVQQARADHVTSRARELAAAMCTPAQRTVLAEFRAEQPDLLCAVGELLDAGRAERAVRLMRDALPLLARTFGVTDLLPYVLRATREFTPAPPGEDRALQMLAARVLLAAGEQEAAAVCVESVPPPELPGQSEPSGPSDQGAPGATSLALLGVLVAEAPAYDEAVGVLAECVRRGVADRDLALLADAAAACFAHLMRGGEHERVEAQCRRLLYDATCQGDDYTAGLLLLWRATAGAAGAGIGPAGARRFVDRALAKLRRLGPDALLAALSTVADHAHGPALRPDVPKLAMVLGALGRTDWPWAYGPPWRPPLLPRLAEQLAADCDASAFERWRAAGELWAVPELVCDILRGRWATATAQAADQQPSVVREPAAFADARPQAGPVEPGRARELPGLTRREAEVARLVATGLTNKQIAHRLNISEWTAINHLRQVMRKSGCGSRVHVANWIRDTGSRNPAPARAEMPACAEASPVGSM